MGRRFLVLAVALLSVAVIYNACAETKFTTVQGTTGTGNPLTPTANEILSGVCSVLTKCNNGLTYSRCESGVLGATGMDKALGLPSGTYSNFSSIIGAEASGTIRGAPTATDSCYTQITSQSCSSPQVAAAYNPNSSNPFAAVASAVPNQTGTACTSAYTPSGWAQLANTTLKSVCPPASNSYDFPTNCPYVISAWSSGTLDTKRNRLLIWGGGSGNNYFGNEVYALDVGSKSMLRLTNPSPIGSCVETLSDGNPNARSTYGGLVYIPTADVMFSFGGNLSGCSGGASQATWFFSPASLTWAQATPKIVGGTGPGVAFASNGAGTGVIAAYDNVNDLIYLDDQYQFFSYSYSLNTYTMLNASATIGLSVNGVIDPVNRFYLVAGNGHMYAISIAAGSNYALQDWTSQVTGCAGLTAATAPGLAYDSATQEVIGWAGGAAIYHFNATTKTCTTVTMAGSAPGAQQTNGTFSRFSYIPTMNFFVLVNDAAQNAFTLGF